MNEVQEYSESPFSIRVGDLRPGDIRDYEIAGPVDVSLDAGRVDDDVELMLRVSAMSEGVVVTGSGTFAATLICHRCLAERDENRSIELTQIFQFAEDEDGRRIDEHGVIDTEPVVRDEVVLDLPLAPLCRSDYKGLCSVCGTDLNSDPCSGHTDESDHPFAALGQLLNPQDT